MIFLLWALRISLLLGAACFGLAAGFQPTLVGGLVIAIHALMMAIVLGLTWPPEKFK